MSDSLIYDLEVDVARQRPPTAANTKTHYVRLAIEDRESLTCADNEARNFAAWMCWHRHGPMVTAVRIISVEL